MMDKKRPGNAYPILDGEAFVNVTLKKEKKNMSWMDAIKNRMNGYMTRRKVNAYFYDDFIEDVPVVTLRRKSGPAMITDSLEPDLQRSELSLFSKFRSKSGGILTTGLIFLAACGMGNHISKSLIPAVPDNDLTRTRAVNEPPVIRIKNDREAFLKSSIVNPETTESKRHRFTLEAEFTGAHTNHVTVGTHTNASGGHTNTVTGANGNPVHSNNADHTNTVDPGSGEHTNNAENQHANSVSNHQNQSSHENWSNTGGGTGTSHTNSVNAHSNSVDD